MMKMKATKDKILVASLIALVIMAFVFLGMAFREGNKCTANPLIYGADKLSSTETGDFSCSCSFSNSNYDPLYFDKENISSLTNYQSTQLKGGNIN